MEVETRVSPKRRIKELWRDRTEGRERFDLPEMSAEIAEELSQDIEFCRRFTEDFLCDVVLEVGEHMFRNDQWLIRRGYGFATPQAIRAEIQGEIESRFASWMEFDPISKHKVSLMMMTKPMLIAAADLRRTRGLTELRESEWFRRIANPLEDGQVVSDVWSEKELDALRDRLQVKVTSDLKPVSIRSAAD